MSQKGKGPVPHSKSPARSRIAAVGAAFAVICAGLVFFGPQATRVIAGDDAGIRDFLRVSRPASPYAAPAWRSVAAPPSSAYAPAGPRLQMLQGPLAIDRAAPIPGEADARPARAPRAPAVSAGLHRRSVCVRLCDGYHFPLGNVGSSQDLPRHEAQCANLCPGAPTRLFVMGAGSEKIDDAVSRNGKPYTALPVAFRHTRERDEACSCGPSKPTSIEALLDDTTLRRGDSFMTASGFRIFEGSASPKTSLRDFVQLSKARSVTRERRATLASIEKASRQGPPLSGSTDFVALPPLAQRNAEAPANRFGRDRQAAVKPFVVLY